MYNFLTHSSASLLLTTKRRIIWSLLLAGVLCLTYNYFGSYINNLFQQLFTLEHSVSQLPRVSSQAAKVGNWWTPCPLCSCFTTIYARRCCTIK